MIDNKYVKKAEEELEYLTGEAAERRLAELRQKAIWDENSMIRGAREEGEEKGKAEEKRNMAKKMLAKGIEIETIIEITELTKEEIESL